MINSDIRTAYDQFTKDTDDPIDKGKREATVALAIAWLESHDPNSPKPDDAVTEVIIEQLIPYRKEEQEEKDDQEFASSLYLDLCTHAAEYRYAVPEATNDDTAIYATYRTILEEDLDITPIDELIRDRIQAALDDVGQLQFKYAILAPG